MERDERNIYIRLGVIIAVWLIAEIILLTRNANAAESAKNAPYSASESSDEDFIAECDEAAKTGQILQMTAIDDDSAMPCCDPEGFGEWYESYCASSREDEETEFETDISTEVGEVESGTDEVPITLYSVGEDTLNPELQAMMYDALNRHGVSYFYEIGICQMWQESSGNIFAENPNGKDKGVLQYRLQYWDWNRGDIFDPAAQIELYAEQMAQRLNSGLSADECISRHNTSDHVSEVNWEYVAQVKQHLSNLREVK